LGRYRGSDSHRPGQLLFFGSLGLSTWTTLGACIAATLALYHFTETREGALAALINRLLPR
jgi:hypothetical protein